MGEDLFFDATLTLLQEQVSDALRDLAPARPADVTDLRARMIRVMVVHTCAEQERTSARTGSPADWDLVGDGLVDAVTAVLLGPVGRSG